MKSLSFDHQTLTIDGNDFELDFNIKEARIIDQKAVVIYAFDELAPKNRQFVNCQAFNSNGVLVWTAEHPTNQTQDTYVNFMKDNRLWNFACFVCTLDFQTGKLKNTEFTK